MSGNFLMDTSFIYALYNQNDKAHKKTVAFSAQSQLKPVAPVVTLIEIVFLFRRDRLSHELDSFWTQFIASHVPLVAPQIEDLKRVQAIMRTYPQFDFVDCCLMALAERLNITQIATYDRRDFSQFRPTHCEYLDLLPN